MAKKKPTLSLTQQQIQDLKKGNKNLSKDIDKCRDRYSKLKSDKQAVERDNKDLRKEVRTLKEEVESYKKEIGMLYGVIEEMNEDTECI